MNFIASIFLTLATSIFVLGLLINYFTHLIPDPLVRLFRYGRANVSKYSGAMQKIEVPKRWFWHFYLWAVFLQLAVTLTVFRRHFTADLSRNWLTEFVTYATGTSKTATVSSSTTCIAVILLQFHLTRRLLETLFVSVYSGTKMNVAHYLLGFTHYTCAILALISCSPGITSGRSSRKDYSISIGDITMGQLLGIFLFVYGNYQQFLAHKAFADLRRGNDKSVASLDHKIPTGGLFESVSCPNYWAEIIIYVGLTFILGFKNYTWNCCTIWVIANQVMAGIMNHKWYQEKFRDAYPKDRKAIIPYIW